MGTGKQTRVGSIPVKGIPTPDGNPSNLPDTEVVATHVLKNVASIEVRSTCLEHRENMVIMAIAAEKRKAGRKEAQPFKHDVWVGT